MQIMYVFLSCTKSKADHRCKAEEMYSESVLFRLCLKYAKTLTERKNIFILSAKHHVLRLSDEIVPYHNTLLDMTNEECEEWAKICKKQMKQKGIDFNKKAIFLTGEKYYKYLKGTFRQEELPLEGKQIGYSLEWLANKVGSANENMLSLTDFLKSALLS